MDSESIDWSKLQALRDRHKRLVSDYRSRADDVRICSGLVHQLRGELIVRTRSDEARRLLESDPAALCAYPPEALQLACVDVHRLRRLLTAITAVAAATNEADKFASLIKDSAGLLQRLNNFVQSTPEAA